MRFSATCRSLLFLFFTLDCELSGDEIWIEIEVILYLKERFVWCLGFIESCLTEGKASKAKEWTREARGVRVYLSKGIGIKLPICGDKRKVFRLETRHHDLYCDVG